MYLCMSAYAAMMISKKHIFFIFTVLCLPLCVSAQLVFTPDAWDFGRIEESGGRVSHTFTGVNRGERPVVILDVVTSCGCTVPEFSRKPVLPGDSTRVTVTFDPMNRPGIFSKELGVYSSERRRIASLSVSGSVIPREKSVEELYPFEAGGGVRLDATLCAFTYVYQGAQKQMSIGCLNTSDRIVQLELLPGESSGALRAVCPRSLAPGERGEINFIYTLPAAKPRYGTLRDVLALRIDGRESDLALVVHGIGVDNPAGIKKTAAPKADLSELTVKFGSVKHGAPCQRRSVTLSNTGAGELIVRAVESRGRVGVSLAEGQRIAPGGSCRVGLTLDPSRQEYGLLTDHILLVTNDPARPMRRLRVTAIIED